MGYIHISSSCKCYVRAIVPSFSVVRDKIAKVDQTLLDDDVNDYDEQND